MKKTVIIILIVLPIFLLITIAFAGKILAIYQHIPVEKVQFIDALNNVYDFENPEHVMELNVGDKKPTTIRILPELASDKEVAYTSSDESICTVDSEGALRGLSYGSATITVTTHDGNKTAYLKVFVKADKVMGVTLPYTEKNMTVGDSFKLEATVELPYAKEKDVLFSSDNPMVVSIVDAKTGEIKAVGPGTAIVTVTTKDGGYTATCKITVAMGTPALAFDFSVADWITVKQSVHQTTRAEINLMDYLKLDPERVQVEDVKFYINDGSNICTITDGVLTILKEMDFITITAYVGDSYETAIYKETIEFFLLPNP